MKILHSVVPRYRPFVTWPDVSTTTLPIKPNSPIFFEKAPLKMEFDEEYLRNVLIHRSQHWGGTTFSAASLSVLPDNYLLNLYLSTRYQVTPELGIMPMRASTNAKNASDMPPGAVPMTEFNPCDHLLTNYILMACLFGGLFELKKNTINPAVRYEAMQLLRIVNTLYFVLHQMLTANPTGEFNDRLVIGQLNSYSKVGDDIGHTITLFFDAEVMASYIDAGGTLETATDHWLQYKTQPPAPE